MFLQMQHFCFPELGKEKLCSVLVFGNVCCNIVLILIVRINHDNVASRGAVGRTHTIVRLQTGNRRKDHGTENFGGVVYVLDRFPQRDLMLWVFMCPINIIPFCRLSIFRLPRRGLPRRGLPRPIYTARATTPLPPLHSYHAWVYPGYHAKGYHAPYLPPRAITPVCSSRLSHQSYHAPPSLVHRVITPAIVFVFCSLPFTGLYATSSSPPTPPPGATRYNLLHNLSRKHKMKCLNELQIRGQAFRYDWYEVEPIFFSRRISELASSLAARSRANLHTSNPTQYSHPHPSPQHCRTASRRHRE